MKKRKSKSKAMLKKIKSRIVEIIGRRILLEKVGADYKGLCPFHDDHNPSLSVCPGKKIFRCWSCGAGGDVVDFVMKYNKVDFKTALKICSKDDQRSATAEEEPRTSVSLAPSSTTTEMQTDSFHEIAVEVLRYFSTGGGRMKYSDGDFFSYRGVDMPDKKCTADTCNCPDLASSQSRPSGYYEIIPKERLHLLIRDAARFWGQKRQRTIAVNESLLKNVRLALTSEIIDRDGIEQPNSDSDSLNLTNGIYCLKSKRLVPHDANFFSTIQFPVRYDPKAKCPFWLKTLDQIFANDTQELRIAKIKLLRQFFGLCLTVINVYHKILVLLGGGRNGKDTTLYPLEQILTTTNYSALSMEQLGNKFNLSILKDKLVNITTEIGSKTIIPDDIIKMLTGQSPITAERKFRDPITFTNNAKLIFATNEMPTSTDKSYALESRLMVIEMTRRFLESERIVGLKEKIAAEELDGIFSWMLKGLEELQAQGRFVVPKEIQRATDIFMRENNSVLAFAEDWLVMDTEGRLSKGRVYELYCLWCDTNRHHAFTKNRFSRIFTDCFPNLKEVKIESDVRAWERVALSKNIPEIFRNVKKKNG